MQQFKAVKWSSCGIILSLVCGLSSCYMDGQSVKDDHYSYQEINPQQEQKKVQTSSASQAKKSYASQDPVQKSTPGPKRAAAPQLPVIE